MSRVSERPVSVVIPTLGRPVHLRRALESLAACDPLPAEVVVVDQSDTGTAAAAADGVAVPRLRIAAQAGTRGRGRAVNCGLELASHRFAFVVDDDCTVSSDWIGVGAQAMEKDPTGLITGRVLPVGDPKRVPSISMLAETRDYTGEYLCHVLYAGNMVCPREGLLEVGGFDPRIVPSAEDCDLCYRWLRDGRTLRHLPELVVWHHDWRTPEELTRLYIRYHRGLGRFYAKHLLAGDLRMLRFAAHDFYAASRGVMASLVLGRPRWTDARRGVLRGLVPGVWQGWRDFR
jgi:GT2 family glycosyltransferase